MARSRKRRKRRAGPAGPAKAREPRPAVEPASRPRRSLDERPPAPWGSFPLTELTVFVGMVMLALGFIRGGFQGTVMIGVGTALASLGGLELTIREHFTGYRSHSALLALACAILAAATTAALVVLVSGSVLPLIPVAVGALAFGGAFFALRGAFRRASGGLSYRVGGLRGG